jgi:hypothetical protein
LVTPPPEAGRAMCEATQVIEDCQEFSTVPFANVR